MATLAEQKQHEGEEKMFKKKKDQDVEVPVPEETPKPTETVEVEMKDKDQKIESPKPAELTEDEKELKILVEHFAKYTGFFTAQDAANITDPMLKAENMNLLFAIFSEVKKNNELTARLISLIEEM